jgi:TonB family protein
MNPTLAQMPSPLNAKSRRKSSPWVSVLFAGLFAGCATPAEAPLDVVYNGSEVDVKPLVIAQKAPVYPLRARLERDGALVTVSFVVDEHGGVGNAQVDETRDQIPHDPAFDDAALVAVRQWRFRPGYKNQVPVKVALRVPVYFQPVED